MERAKEYIQSLKLMIELNPNSTLAILRGEVDTLTKNYLNLSEKQYLFKIYIHHVVEDYEKTKNQKIIDNSVNIFLKLYKKGFLLNRISDLSTYDCKNLLFILDNLNKYKMIQNDYNNSEIEKLYKFMEQVRKSANLYGLYDFLPNNNQTSFNRRKQK